MWVIDEICTTQATHFANMGSTIETSGVSRISKVATVTVSEFERNKNQSILKT